MLRFFFYGWWTPAYLLLLCGSVVFNYTVGELILRTSSRKTLPGLVLMAGVAVNLLFLAYYKYLFPLLHWFEQFGLHVLSPGASVVLPLGISFFTFTQIGYLADCKAGMTSGRRFLDYALFVTFFPHLIAGPILHHREMMPQYERPETWRFRLDHFCVGLSIFLLGLAKKDVIADHFAFHANFAFEHAGELSLAQAWAGALDYSMQLYFDFSGYSEMAIGLALLFNIRFPANFDSPYKSASIIEYWQRWHMTLTRYLNLYLYNPIALWVTRWRSTRKLPIGRPALKSVSGFMALIAFPTMTTMLLIGLWHGAGIQFILYGLLHGFYLTINHVWRLYFQKKNTPPLSGAAQGLNQAWKVGLTFLAVLVSQVLFRASSVGAAVAMVGNMLGDHTQMYPGQYQMQAETLALALVFVWTAPNILQIFARWQPSLTEPVTPLPSWARFLEWRPTLAWGTALALVAVLAILALGGQTEFLYFRF